MRAGGECHEDANEQRRLKELKAVQSWERASYIETGGWDKMPGEEQADSAVARSCADGLGALMEKSGAGS